jgi:hypothetical protein
VTHDAISAEPIEEDFMDHLAFDALSRRASLMSFGTVGLAAALTNPTTTAAKKNNRNKRKKRKKGDANELCKKQVGRCTTFITDICQREEGCEAESACCSILQNCNFNGFFLCIDAAASSQGLIRPPMIP